MRFKISNSESQIKPKYTWVGQELKVNYSHHPQQVIITEINGVQGLLTEGDISFLLEKVKVLPPYAVVVEIGSFLGLSALVMALGLYDTRNFGARIFCIDLWEWDGKVGDDEETRIVKDKATPDEVFMENIKNSGLEGFIRPIKSRSVDAVLQFPPKSIDLAFVDGDHSFESCYGDLDALYPKIKPGGRIIGHDYVPGPHQGVCLAVHKFAYEKELDYIVCRSRPSSMYEIIIPLQES